MTIRYRVIGDYTMNGPTSMDAGCLLHEPRPIYRLAHLKSILFLPKGPLHCIRPGINACAVVFSDENTATDNRLCLEALDMNGKAPHEGRLQGHGHYPFRSAGILIQRNDIGSCGKIVRIYRLISLLVCTDFCRDSVEQHQSGSPLHVLITDTLKVFTTTSNSEEDTKLSYIATAFFPDACQSAPPWCLRTDQTRLVRLSDIENEHILEIPDTKIGIVDHGSSLSSWPTLPYLRGHTRCDIAWSLNVGPDNNPKEPPTSDLKYWKYNVAKQLSQFWFCKRAKRVVKRRTYPAADWYAHHLQQRRISAK